MEYIRIDEHDHFYKQYEDFKNNMYFLCLNDDIEKWIEENLTSRYDLNVDDYDNVKTIPAVIEESLTGSYDINCDGYYEYDHCNYIIIGFEKEGDAVAFKLRWL